MGKGGFTGGSTIIRGGSNWFSYGSKVKIKDLGKGDLSPRTGQRTELEQQVAKRLKANQKVARVGRTATARAGEPSERAPTVTYGTAGPVAHSGQPGLPQLDLPPPISETQAQAQQAIAALFGRVRPQAATDGASAIRPPKEEV